MRTHYSSEKFINYLYYPKFKFVLIAIFLSFAISGYSQLSGFKNIPGDYIDLQSAISDLNNSGVGAGGVTFNLLAGNPQVAPSGGYGITAQGSSNAQVVFNGNGNNIVAFFPQATGIITDAIFKLIGADWITLNGFVMQENPLNVISSPVGSNNMTEWGIALLYSSVVNGSQNNSILNNTISLNRLYSNTFGIYSNTRHSATDAITNIEIENSTTAPNSFNKVYGNNISDVNMGIAFIGTGNTLGNSPNEDHGNDIGGTTSATGNTITNWGGSTAESPYSFNSNSSYCIYMNLQCGDNISYNNITSAAVNPSVDFRAIFHEYKTGYPADGFTTNINNNSISMISSQTSGVFTCIESIGNNITIMNVNINNNTIQNCQITGSSSSTTMVGILNQGIITSLNANGNIFKNNTTSATTGGFYGIFNLGNVKSSINMNDNQIGNSSGGAITFTDINQTYSVFIYNVGGAATATLSISNNNFQGIVYNQESDAGNIYIYNSANTFSQNINLNMFINLNVNTSGQVLFIYNSVAVPADGFINVSNNSIVTGFNKVAGGSDIYFYYNVGGSAALSTESIMNNNFSHVTMTGSTILRGLHCAGSYLRKIIDGNTFSDIHTSGTGEMTIITCKNGGNPGDIGNIINNNTISNISCNHLFTGIDANNEALQTITSNVISGITTVNSTIGINVTGREANIGQNIVTNIHGEALGGSIWGISVAVINCNIYKNKICDISTNQNVVASFRGLIITGGTTVNVYNNIIGDLRAPILTVPELKGIDISGTANANFSYNTIFLNTTSSGTGFGSTTFYGYALGSLSLRNNILINTSNNGTEKSIVLNLFYTLSN
ncbi:MAG: hypothetical protein ABI840_04700, partial [bacterium]